MSWREKRATCVWSCTLNANATAANGASVSAREREPAAPHGLERVVPPRVAERGEGPLPRGRSQRDRGPPERLHHRVQRVAGRAGTGGDESKESSERDSGQCAQHDESRRFALAAHDRRSEPERHEAQGDTVDEGVKAAGREQGDREPRRVERARVSPHSNQEGEGEEQRHQRRGRGREARGQVPAERQGDHREGEARLPAERAEQEVRAGRERAE